jgi:hypothetical protein
MSFETYRNIMGNYYVSQLADKEPSAFNGIVRFRKYKVTIELIEEPQEVLAERLQKLWDECDNLHSIKAAAASIGYILQGRPGSKAKKSTYL